MQNLLESYLISNGVLKKYKSLHFGKLRYLAIVIERVLKKSKEAIFQKLKNAKPIEEVNEAVTHHAPDHMNLEFVSYVDGREAVAKAVNLLFMDNLKRHNLGGELDGQILLEHRLNKAIQIAGSKGPEPDLLLVYGPVRSHLGFPAWRIRYTEIV
ncbi:Decaprenyl diphosphate synthase-like superfamily [Sesbania bispinosa]|nr:Decaprenyl diphosphate synthase-like superfamily [Sesbania bispinosa]